MYEVQKALLARLKKKKKRPPTDAAVGTGLRDESWLDQSKVVLLLPTLLRRYLECVSVGVGVSVGV